MQWILDRLAQLVAYHAVMNRLISTIIALAIAVAAPLAAADSTARATITITSDTPAATVYIDGERRGAITTGASLVIEVDEGSHELTVAAKGHHPYEREFTISARDALAVRASLKSEVPSYLPVPFEARSTPPPIGWRIAAWSSLVAIAAGVALTVHAQSEITRAENELTNQDNFYDPAIIKRGEHWVRVGQISVWSTFAATVFGAYAGYRGYIKPRRATIVVPTVTADGGSVTLQRRF